MGKVMSVALRKTKRFNAENRAHRFLDNTKDKPIAAPKYEANLKELNRVLQENPNIASTLAEKNIDLDNRLKQVYVTSSDPLPQQLSQKRYDPDKPLPSDRKAIDDYEYGFKEPEKVSRGHITIRNALEFINNHQMEPEKWTATKIAEDYKLKVPIVENILKYFRPFETFIPDKTTPRIKPPEQMPRLITMEDFNTNKGKKEKLKSESIEKEQK